MVEVIYNYITADIGIFLFNFSLHFRYDSCMAMCVYYTEEEWNPVDNFKKINQKRIQKVLKSALFMEICHEIEIQYTAVLNEGMVDLAGHREIAWKAATMNTWEKL